MTTMSVLDAAGRRRSPATVPGYHAGRPARNKGIRYPADPPTVDEIVAVMRHAPALELAREGVPLNIIQRQLGHANLGTTWIYLQGDRSGGDHHGRAHAPGADDVRQRRAATLIAS